MNDDGIRKLFDMVDVLDVADLRILAKHLWRQRDFFKKTFDIIGDSVVVINSSGEIFYCNRSACELLGISNPKRSDILWKYIPEFIALFDFGGAPMDAGNSFFSKEIRVSYPQKRILSVTMTAMRGDGEGDEKMFAVRIADVTEARSTSEKALNDEKISSVMLLASGVAHEIGNPLNAIGLRLQLMQRQCKLVRDREGRGKLEVSIGICLGEISRLDGIVRNFLRAFHPQKPKMDDVSLDKVLEEALALTDVEFKSLNIKVVCNVGKLPTVLGDFSQLKQIFFNVLKNSCEAISGGGAIVIDGSANDSDVILSFTDSGVGISCELLDKIFQPYFSTKKDGNGLGMVIIERILREHGATIDILSTENVGTKISLCFPRKDKRMPLLPAGEGHKNLQIADRGSGRSDLLVAEERTGGRDA
ncbi:MAG: PAS domain-containing protein [Puniceicoccales bacterium]|jgi:signal transduction histidine kinase|nr:PAS domain-containing protein [Puniceicoccales bacterium]